MEEFEALVSSLGELAVTYIGKSRLRTLEVYGDRANGSAHVEIYLHDQSWDEQSRAIDKMIELREMFLDDVAIDYRFATVDSSTREAAAARRPTYSLA